jgi:diguanylate cyclase (GGDEF)-like protein
MIKTDFSQGHKNENDVPSFFALPTVLYGLNFGVLGAMANAYLHVNFFGDFGLYFGQIFVLLCLVTRGLNAALIAALLSSITAAWHANDAYLICIFMLEMLFVHVAMRKGYFLFYSSIIYWLTIGVPLLLLLHALTSFSSAELLFINGVTRALNGLLCISVVAILCWFLPSHYIYKKYYSNPPQLASLIFSLCMLTVTLPAMLIAIFVIWQSTIHNETNVTQNLNNASAQLVKVTDIELKRHLDSISTVSSIVSNQPNHRIQPMLDATVNNYELYKSMLYADRYGRVMNAAPREKMLKLLELDYPSVRDRSYFKAAKEVGEPFISDAIVGKGFGDSLIICFVAPIYNGSQFGGIIQGAMTLPTFTEFSREHLISELDYVITDNKGRIIAATERLGLPLLSNFDYQQHTDPLIKRVPLLLFNQTPYMFAQSKTQNDWTVTVLMSPKEITSILVEYFFILILSTIFVLATFALVAKSLSKRITKPLVDIAESFPNTEKHPQILQDSQVSTEMVKLTQRLIDSHDVMANFQQQLSEQVHNKTKQLKQLNRELYSIAQKDSLTQLLNRAGFNRLAITSYRNCVRNHINMSLVLLDIDHFKKINDTYGHPFGDKCIVAVAKAIQKHCKRDTDIIGRYGGEEFIVMIVGGDLNVHHERIKMVKDELQDMSFKRDKDIVNMTVSAGICSIETDFSLDFEDLLQLSDNQLYLSKREGRNKISTVIR